MEKQFVVSKLWRYNNTYHSFFLPAAELVYVKVLPVTEDMLKLDTSNGPVWTLAAASGPEDVAELFPDLDPKIREENWTDLSIRLRSIDHELGELEHTLQISELLKLYYQGTIGWDDIAPFMPQFAGINREGVDRNRSEWLASADYNITQMTKMRDAIIQQLSELTGQPFEKNFLLGNVIFWHSRAPGEHYDHLILGSIGVTSSDDDRYRDTKEVYALLQALYTAVGGRHMLVKKLGIEGNIISFDIMGVRGTAVTKLKKHTETNVSVYVEITSPTRPCPFRVYL